MNPMDLDGIFTTGGALVCMVIITSLCVGLTVLYSMRSRVDPWELQRNVMRCSPQEVPARPTLTYTSLMYGALVCEELSELLITQYGVVSVQPQGNTPRLSAAVDAYSQGLLDLATTLRAASAEQRRMLASLKEQGWDPSTSLSESEAEALLDDVTDIAVVTAGYAISAGLPGGEAYLEVSRSNLSKVGRGGRIETDASGKWIKGPNYSPPNLRAVLRLHERRLQRAHNFPDSV